MTKITDFSAVHVDENNSVIILATQTQSEVFDCGTGTQICGLYVSAELAGANLTFRVSNVPASVYGSSEMWDGATPAPAMVNYTVPNTVVDDYAYITVLPAIFSGVRYLSIVSDTAPVNDAQIFLACRPT